jgi:hypothetical protein
MSVAAYSDGLMKCREMGIYASSDHGLRECFVSTTMISETIVPIMNPRGHVGRNICMQYSGSALHGVRIIWQ